MICSGVKVGIWHSTNNGQCSNPGARAIRPGSPVLNVYKVDYVSLHNDDFLAIITAPRARFPRGFAYGSYDGARLGLCAAFDYWWSDGLSGVAWACLDCAP